MKKKLGLFILLASMGVTSLIAASIDGIRATSGRDFTRVVMDITDRPSDWDISYNASKDALKVHLIDTHNNIAKPIKYENGNDSLLKGVSLISKDNDLDITIKAQQPVMHNVFWLDKPDRMVVDLFTDYEQKTIKNVDSDIIFFRWNRSISSGRLLMYIVINSAHDNIAVNSVEGERSSLRNIMKKLKAKVGMPLTPLQSSAYNDYLKKSYLEQTKSGYKISFVQPKYEAVINGKTYPITGINVPRQEDDFILYTPNYGFSTKTNKFGIEAVIDNNQLLGLSAGDTPLKENLVILSAHGKMTSILKFLKKEQPIHIRLAAKQPDMSNKIALEGIPVLENGKYIGGYRPEEIDGKVSKSFIGTTADGDIVFVVIKGGEASSIGVSLHDAGNILKDIGIENALMVAKGENSQIFLETEPQVPDEIPNKMVNKVIYMK